MRKTTGITMVELLIALLIFASVFALSSQGIIASLRGNQLQEGATSTQAKLRRVNEVVTQQLRGSVFGAITSSPYSSDGDSISFALLNGAGGYPVQPHDNGKNSSFVNSANLTIIANVADEDELGLENKQAIMVNNKGEAVVFDVGNVQKIGNAYEVRVVHPGCANTIDYTENTLLFQIDTVGLNYDANQDILYRKTGSGSAVPLAYDISDFKVEYIYDFEDGSSIVQSTPVLKNSHPTKSATINDKKAVLARLQVSIEAQQATSKGSIKRSYTSQVELVDTTKDKRILSLEGVSVCNG